MPTKKQIFYKGFAKTFPFQSGVLPFGIIYSTLAASAGFPWWLIVLISVLVFGGSSQLVFIDLYVHLSSALQAALGANIVNARHLIYSAGVSDKFSHFKLKWRLLLSYLLTDQLYAISSSSTQELETIEKDLHPWFFFGSGFCTWFFWIFSCGLGGFLGKIIPTAWNLGFAIPLMFMPMIFVVSQNSYAYLTCLLAVIFVVLFKGFPFGLGVFFSIFLSSFIGFILKKTLATVPLKVPFEVKK